MPESSLPYSPASTGTVGRVSALLEGWDQRALRAVATRHWPGAGPLLPRLSRTANHGLLWFGAAAGMAALRTSAALPQGGGPRCGVPDARVRSHQHRRQAGGAPRTAPVLDAVPLIRQLKRQPFTTSFPSGHAASAAAFATGVALESQGWGAVVAPGRRRGRPVPGLHGGALPERRAGGCGAGRRRRLRRTRSGADPRTDALARPAARRGARTAGRGGPGRRGQHGVGLLGPRRPAA